MTTADNRHKEGLQPDTDANTNRQTQGDEAGRAHQNNEGQQGGQYGGAQGDVPGKERAQNTKR